MNHFLSVFMFAFLSVSGLYAKTICLEKSDGISKLNFVWIGEKINDAKKKNLNSFCTAINKYLKESNGDEPFNVNIYTDSNSINEFADACDGIPLNVRSTSELLANEPDENKILYNFFLRKKNYAPATDYLRILALRTNGGCYVDIGYHIDPKNSDDRENTFFSKDLADTYHGEKTFFTRTKGTHSAEDLRQHPVLNVESQNNLLVANIGNPILEKLYEEMVFKNQFAKHYLPFIEGLYDNCEGDNIVLGLIGQHAYNDVYKKIFYDDPQLFSQIAFLDVEKNLPYSGANSWRVPDRKNCAAFVVHFYPRLHNQNFVSDNLGYSPLYGIDILSKQPLGLMVSKGDLSLRIVHNLVRNFRYNSGMIHPGLRDVDEKYVNALTQSLNQETAIKFFGEDAEEICASMGNALQRGLRTIGVPRFVKKSEIVDEKHLISPYYLGSATPSLTSWHDDDIYFGHMIGCNNQAVFVPAKKVSPLQTFDEKELRTYHEHNVHQALKVLGTTESNSFTVDLLAKRLQDKMPQMRSLALRALGASTTKDEEVHDAIIGRLTDADENVQREALRALIALEVFSPRIIRFARNKFSPLVNKLKDADLVVRTQALEELAWYQPKDDEIVQRIAEGLNDDDAGFRVKTIDVLGKLPRGVLVQNLLNQAVANSNVKVRRAAMTFISEGNLSWDGKQEALTGALVDEDAEVQIAAARRLENFGYLKGSVSTVENLLKALGDEKERVRAVAEKSLINMGRIDASTLTPEQLVSLAAQFHSLLNSSKQQMSVVAMQALSSIQPRDKSLQLWVVSKLQNEVGDYRFLEEAQNIFIDNGPHDADVLNAIQNVVLHAHRSAGADTAAQIFSRIAPERYLKLIEDSQTVEIRLRLVKNLGKIRDRNDVRDLFIKLLRGSDSAIREAAEKAAIGFYFFDDSMKQRVKAASDVEQNPEIKETLIRLLRNLSFR